MRYGDQGPATLPPASVLPAQTLPSTHSLVEHCTPSCSGLGDASDPEGRAGFAGSPPLTEQTWSWREGRRRQMGAERKGVAAEALGASGLLWRAGASRHTALGKVQQ